MMLFHNATYQPKLLTRLKSQQWH